LLDLPQAGAAARRADDGIARSGGGKIQILAHAVESPRIRKQRQLNGAHLLRRGLSGQRDRHGSVGSNRDRGGARRYRYCGLQRIARGGNDVALRILLEFAAARVGVWPVGNST
jgi:hypothetical protein